MKRRSFFASSAAIAAATGCTGKTGGLHDTSGHGGYLAGKTLAELRDEHRYWLFEDYLPFVEKHVVDHEYGGFMCHTDRDGTHITTNKRGWYEGRGIWGYSFLYSNLAPEEKYLDIARKSVEFVMKHDPGRGGFWPEGFSREGKAIQEPDARGYGNLFIANGLAEYAKASGEERYLKRAREILLDFVDYYDRADYCPNAAQSVLGKEAPEVPGARVLGVWMVLIRLTTQMLEQQDNPAVKTVNDRCIEAISRYHLNPEFDLLNEVINHDMSRGPEPVDQLVTAHAIEILWMIMYEALRRSDKELFYTSAEWFKRHVEVFWDNVYGGVFHSCHNVNANVWALNKVLWAQEEVLIGLMAMIEHLDDDWAVEWYDRMYTYVLDKFPLKPYGHAIWNLAADRKVTFKEHYPRIGNFHHPRHLMLNTLALERMIAREGRSSGAFS